MTETSVFLSVVTATMDGVPHSPSDQEPLNPDYDAVVSRRVGLAQRAARLVVQARFDERSQQMLEGLRSQRLI